MALRQAIQSCVGRGPQGTARVGDGRLQAVLLALVPLGVIIAQPSWPTEGLYQRLSPPETYGLNDGDVEDGIFASAPDRPGNAAEDAAYGERFGLRALGLAARGARLATRAAMIAALLAEGSDDPAEARCRSPASIGGDGFARVEGAASRDDPVAARLESVSSAGLRLSEGADRSDIGWLDGSAPDPDAVAARLGAIEARQAATVLCLSEVVTARVARVRDALAATGLSSRLWDGKAAVGGPFVPVSVESLGVDLDQAAMLLREGRAEASHLDEATERVPLRKPMEGPVEMTSTFGVRLDPFYGRPALHTGVDLTGAYGATVEATAAGTVTMAGPSGGYGNMVEIDHGHGLVTRYAHLSMVLVAPNQRVAAGSLIGRVGASGRATGPHLHYETRIDGEPVDPARFLKAGATIFASNGGR